MSTTTLKLSYNGELRRVPTGETLTFEELKNYAKNLFPVLNGVEKINALQFAWIDDENDCVLISSDLELQEAFRTMRSGGKGYLRFEVRPYAPTTTTTAAAAGAHATAHATATGNNQIHVGITCDECGQCPITGIRYKCSVRSNYDICQSCEQKSPQPFPMIKFYETHHTSPQSHIIVAIHPGEKSLRRCEKAKSKEWKEKKHRGVRCNECGVRPITGIRYKCTRREDYDLCSECEAKTPIQPFPMVKVYSPDQCPEGLQVYTSDGLGKHPRDITIECDIDMSKGMKILQELLHHGITPTTTASPWIPQESPAPPTPTSDQNQTGEVPIHRFVRCNGCGMKPIMGYRYKCTIRPDFDLCSSCEGKAPQPFPMVKIYNSEQQARGCGRGGGRFGGGGVGGGGGRGWHGRCGRWRNAEAAAERAREHFDAVVQEKANQSEKETTELEEALISVTLEQAMSENSITSFEESKSGTESIPEAYAFSPSAPLATVHASPAPSFPPKPVNSKPMARFVRDVTMPDGTNVQPASTFVKTWRIRNDGSQPWPEGCCLINAGGDSLFTEEELRIPVASVSPGEEVDLSATLTAPCTSGRHVGYFRLQDSEGNWFGQRLWSDIRVIEVEDNLWQVVGEEENEEEEPIPVQTLPTTVSLPPPPSESELWAKELDILAAMGFMDHDILLPLLRTHLVNPAAIDGSPNPEGMQTLILTLLSNM